MNVWRYIIMVNINQSVAILCDGNNVERSIHSLLNENVMLNFDELIPKLLGQRNLNRLIYFREGRHISDRLAERLHEKFYGTVVPCHKSADIPLSIKATQLASKVDTIIIMSGDSDYVDLVKHLKSEGVRVEICAVKANTASILLAEADYFHAITKTDVFKLPNKNNRSFQQRKPNGTAPVSSENSTGSEKPSPSVDKPSSQPIATTPLVNTVPKSGSSPLDAAAKKSTKKSSKKSTKKVASPAPLAPAKKEEHAPKEHKPAQSKPLEVKKEEKKEPKKSIASKLKKLIS